MATTALSRSRRRRLSRLLTIAAALALVGGLAFVWVRVVQTLRQPASTAQSQALGQPGALVWDDRVFTTPAQLKAYLGPKAWRRWSLRHPTAFGVPAVSTPKTTAKTAPKSTPKTTAKKTPVKTTTTTVTETPVAVSPPARATTQSQSLLARALTLLLVLGGLALGASALVPYRVAPVALRRLYAQPDRRPIALAAATVMVLGFGVAFYLG